MVTNAKKIALTIDDKNTKKIAVKKVTNTRKDCINKW